MSIVAWKKSSVKTIPILDEKGAMVKQVALIEGWNDIPDEDWFLARLHVRDLIKRGWILEKGEIKVNKETGLETLPKVDLKHLQLAEALNVIHDTGNLISLKRWLDNPEEGRVEVRNALNKEIEEVERIYPNFRSQKVNPIARRKFFEQPSAE